MSFRNPASRKGSLPMTGSVLKDDTPIDFTSQIAKMLKRGSPCATGSFGVVYRCVIGKSNKSKKEVAVKVFKIDDQRTIEKIGNAIHRELMVWLRLKHATIVPLLGIANVDSPFPALVSQWMASGTLDMYLKQGTIALSAKVELAMGVANGLKYLHSQNVVHGDLHPGNVLIDDSGNARLTDFGLATVAGDVELQLSTLSVNRDLDSRWRAPEVIGIEDSDHRGGRPTFKSDVYSFGGVMFFIISGDMPWKEKKPSQIWIALSQRAMHARPDNILDDHWDLIQSCWSWDAKDRPGAAEVVEQLPSTYCDIPDIPDILQSCPRFRLLVIGKTGVGKSSLVHQVFKVNPVHVSSQSWSKADINNEFISPQNRHFVLHDSEGFEDYDSHTFVAAKEFIARRREMPEPKDRIHAVWLLLSIPHADGQLLESEVKEFLESRKTILGNIPIIVVFTKHDVLLDALEFSAIESEEYDEAAFDKLKSDTLNKLCIRPLTDVAGSDILHATVSTKYGYESTVEQLIDLTIANVDKSVAPEAALAMMVTQRLDISLKVRASIALGKKRYWRVLMNSSSSTMWDCLSVIHKDIIAIWNYNDPHCHLTSVEFRGLIINDLDRYDFPNTIASVGTIAGIMSALAGPFFPIVVPIAAGVVVARWCHDISQQPKISLRRIMTYIVDLTCIMQIVFLLAPTGSISRRVIKIAMKAYEVVGKSSVHSAIQSWHMPLTPGGRNDVLEKMVTLIEDHSIKTEEVQEPRTKIGPLVAGLELDEEW